MPASTVMRDNLSETSGDQLSELETLMTEFPEWKNKYPDIYSSLHPVRFEKHKHHLKHQKPLQVVNNRNVSMQAPTGNTHYQETYKPLYGRPRSSKRPPLSPRDPSPPKMTFETSNRTEFVARDLTQRATIIKKENKSYAPPKDAMEVHTHYSEEFVEKHAEHEPRRQAHMTSKNRVREVNGKFFDDTTAKEHYKVWPAQKTSPFAEPPSVADSIIFPSSERHMNTTTKLAYPGARGERSQAVKPLDGNLTAGDGNMELDTTHRVTYTGHPDFRRSAKARPKLAPVVVAPVREKFASETQTQADFPAFNGMPARRRPAQPAPSTIQIKYDNLKRFDTEQRQRFTNIDAEDIKMSQSQTFKKLPETYKPPTEKFESMTSQKRDYPPLDLNAARNPMSKTTDGRFIKYEAKFEDTTTSKEFFKQWDIHPRIRYGDPFEDTTYVQPTTKFDGTTTNNVMFHKPANVEVVKSMKPAEMPEELNGEHDFSTVYRQTYVPPKLVANMPKEERIQLLRELRKMKAQKMRISSVA